jgi:hypothetical protein
MSKIDYSKLLGFGTIADHLSQKLDFQHETLADKLGAKVGGLETIGPVIFQDETFADKLGAKLEVEDGGDG